MQLNLENIEIYDGKSMADILERIDKTSEKKSKRISELTDMLSGMIDDLDDAVVLVPLVKEYLEVDIKNDKQMVELAKIVQRLLTGYMRNAENVSSAGPGVELSESEKDDLQKIAKEMRKKNQEEKVQQEVDEFEKRANQAIESLNKT